MGQKGKIIGDYKEHYGDAWKRKALEEYSRYRQAEKEPVAELLLYVILSETKDLLPSEHRFFAALRMTHNRRNSSSATG
ncbi:MAG: hypothetical protein ACYC5N_07285 [Endomicrobiales bacterium]